MAIGAPTLIDLSNPELLPTPDFVLDFLRSLIPTELHDTVLSAGDSIKGHPFATQPEVVLSIRTMEGQFRQVRANLGALVNRIQPGLGINNEAYLYSFDLILLKEADSKGFTLSEQWHEGEQLVGIQLATIFDSVEQHTDAKPIPDSISKLLQELVSPPEYLIRVIVDGKIVAGCPFPSSPEIRLVIRGGEQGTLEQQIKAKLISIIPYTPKADSAYPYSFDMELIVDGYKFWLSKAWLPEYNEIVGAQVLPVEEVVSEEGSTAVEGIQVEVEIKRPLPAWAVELLGKIIMPKEDFAKIVVEGSLNSECSFPSEPGVVLKGKTIEAGFFTKYYRIIKVITYNSSDRGDYPYDFDIVFRDTQGNKVCLSELWGVFITDVLSTNVDTQRNAMFLQIRLRQAIEFTHASVWKKLQRVMDSGMVEVPNSNLVINLVKRSAVNPDIHELIPTIVTGIQKRDGRWMAEVYSDAGYQTIGLDGSKLNAIDIQAGYDMESAKRLQALRTEWECSVLNKLVQAGELPENWHQSFNGRLIPYTFLLANGKKWEGWIVGAVQQDGAHFPIPLFRDRATGMEYKVAANGVFVSLRDNKELAIKAVDHYYDESQSIEANRLPELQKRIAAIVEKYFPRDLWENLDKTPGIHRLPVEMRNEIPLLYFQTKDISHSLVKMGPALVTGLGKTSHGIYVLEVFGIEYGKQLIGMQDNLQGKLLTPEVRVEHDVDEINKVSGIYESRQNRFEKLLVSLRASKTIDTQNRVASDGGSMYLALEGRAGKRFAHAWILSVNKIGNDTIIHLEIEGKGYNLGDDMNLGDVDMMIVGAWAVARNEEKLLQMLGADQKYDFRFGHRDIGTKLESIKFYETNSIIRIELDDNSEPMTGLIVGAIKTRDGIAFELASEDGKLLIVDANRITKLHTSLNPEVASAVRENCEFYKHAYPNVERSPVFAVVPAEI